MTRRVQLQTIPEEIATDLDAEDPLMGFEADKFREALEREDKLTLECRLCGVFTPESGKKGTYDEKKFFRVKMKDEQDKWFFCDVQCYHIYKKLERRNRLKIRDRFIR